MSLVIEFVIIINVVHILHCLYVICLFVVGTCVLKGYIETNRNILHVSILQGVTPDTINAPVNDANHIRLSPHYRIQI